MLDSSMIAAEAESWLTLGIIICSAYNKNMRQFIANNKSKILHIVRSLYPDARSVCHVDRGYDNYIVIVDNCHVLRFPRSEAVWKRGELERFVLSQLKLPNVQKIVRVCDDPPYLELTFLQGEHMSEEEFRQLPIQKQKDLGSQIAEFAYRLHCSVNVEEFAAKYAKLTPQDRGGETYDEYLQRVLGDFTLPTPAQDKIAKSYLKAWQDIRPSKPVVVHDDLHIQNLLLCDGKIAGVIDFGAVCIGTAEQELRQVYRLSSAALDSAVKTYNSLAHTKLNIKTARIWAITQELAAYSRELQSKTKTPAFQRSCEHLALWFPEAF